MLDGRGMALIVIVVLGLVSSILSLNRRLDRAKGELAPPTTPRGRAVRLVVATLMVAATAVLWFGNHAPPAASATPSRSSAR
jgi:hypothetical protein